MNAIHRYSIALALFGCFMNPASADQFGNFTYEVFGNTVTITDYPDSAVGPVVIPSTIAGKPVKVIGDTAFNEVAGLTHVTIPQGVTTIGSDAFALCPALTGLAIPSSVVSIGANAFYECTALTGLVIPSGVTSIGEQAFFHCTGLTELSFPAGVTVIESKLCEGCTGLTRLTMSGSVTTIRNDAFTGCHGLVSVTIPGSVDSIENYAFFDCIGLRNVTIPAGVTSIGNGAFDECDELDRVFFMGNAPVMGDTVFVVPANNLDLTIYFFNGKTGFTSPKWLLEEYKTSSMGTENPVAPWLILNNLPLNSDLQEDANQDGVNLLMACALDLDPSRNLSGSLPKPVVGAGQMSLTYYSGALGITYSVVTSTDLIHWTATGVTISPADANLLRTASVPLGSPSRFMRLMVHN